ncbi:DNA gyrase inhibitor YacG [Thiolapillus sp.]
MSLLRSRPVQSEPRAPGKAPATVSCPSCGQPVKWEKTSIWRPFCSRRCQLIDLNEWLSDEEEEPQNPD